MPTSPLALARERLKSIADAQSVLTGKCAVLADLDAAGVECWKRYTPGDFHFLAIGESASSFGGVDAPTAIHAVLYAYSDGADAEAMDDLVVLLKSQWTDASNYPDGELACTEVTFDPYETLLSEPAGVLLRAHLICYFPEV